MQSNEPTPYVKIADNIIKTTSDRLSKKYQMHLMGVKSGMMGCVNSMGLHFQVNRKLNKDEARCMIVECVQSFLADINQNEAIRKHLQVTPFDAEHVEIIFFLSAPDGNDFYHPDLSVITACDGKIKYSTYDPENKYKYKSREIESFEDAVKILQNQASSNQTQ